MNVLLSKYRISELASSRPCWDFENRKGYKNNLTGITLGIMPIWGIKSSTLHPLLTFSNPYTRFRSLIWP